MGRGEEPRYQGSIQAQEASGYRTGLLRGSFPIPPFLLHLISFFSRGCEFKSQDSWQIFHVKKIKIILGTIVILSIRHLICTWLKNVKQKLYFKIFQKFQWTDGFWSFIRFLRFHRKWLKNIFRPNCSEIFRSSLIFRFQVSGFGVGESWVHIVTFRFIRAIYYWNF